MKIEKVSSASVYQKKKKKPKSRNNMDGLPERT